MRTLVLTFMICSLAWGQTCNCSGSISSYDAGTQPACNASNRGTVIIVLGGKGQPDLLQACVRDGAGRYNWVNSGVPNTNTFVNSPVVGGCPVFPDNNIWNATIDSLPLDSNSAAIINTFATSRLGTVPSMYLNLADALTPMFSVSFSSTENDPGKYPVAPNMQVEGYTGNSTFPVSGGPYPGDSHLLVLRTDQCKLYEIFAIQSASPPYNAGSGATFDLTQNDLRPDGWTSADAAGLPIWPGILTYNELFGSDEIKHMLRFTLSPTRNSYVWPARHRASSNSSLAVPPMGSRWRLKSGFDEKTCHENENSGQAYPAEMQKLIRALKHYGMIVSDNGLAIRITADSDPRWGDPNSSTSPTWVLNGWMHCVTGSDFEVIDESSLMVSSDSAAVAPQ